MKSLLHHIFLLLIAMLSITACSDIDPFETDETRGMELTINCVNPNNTRATMPGDNAYNENAIKTIHYFLYVSGKTNENAVMKGKINIAEGTNGTATIRIPMNESELNTLVFPRPIEECEVYLIANLPDGVRPAGAADDDPKNWTNTTLATLRAMSVTANFQGDPVQTSFVMEGLGKARITSRNKTVAAEGNIIIERLASKITSRIAVAETFTDSDGKVWTPQVSGMEIHLDNAVSNTTLNADFGTVHFDYAARTAFPGTVNGTLGEGGESVAFHVYQPFYSYPCTWDYSDDNAMALYIKLPWQTDSGDGTMQYVNCFYKVYLPTMQLDRNCWYNLDLKIGMLGSFTEADDPVEITGIVYKVIDWKNGFADWSAGLNIDTELLSAHYLVVEQNNYIVNNKNTFEIPFITSHNCVIEDLEVTTTDFGTTDNPKNDPKDITSQAVAGKWLTVDGNTIKLNHALNNDFEGTKNYDYTPYKFTFTLCHENNKEKFKERITITQKPAISITAHLNSYRESYLNGDFTDSNNGISGYMYINGRAANSSGSGDYGGAYGLYLRGNDTNKNPYMYTIEVTVLPSGSDFVLGDPRTDTPATPTNTQSLEFTNFEDAPGIEGTASRSLQNYYGTKTDASVQNMLAPKFRIASSHGVTQPVDHTDARNRAATYQEDGYPAGRWRVPTMAEVQFIIKLSADGKIPTLFNNGSAYWCANGQVTPKTGGGFTPNVGTSGNYSVRCVYDDWYWEYSQYPRMESRGEHPNKYNQFTWGDETN